jgi:hypothetical protein
VSEVFWLLILEAIFGKIDLDKTNGTYQGHVCLNIPVSIENKEKASKQNAFLVPESALVKQGQLTGILYNRNRKCSHIEMVAYWENLANKCEVCPVLRLMSNISFRQTGKLYKWSCCECPVSGQWSVISEKGSMIMFE